jgi:ABC-type multidrug transport system ATPase subunit
VLHEIALKGSIVIASIHQPSFRILKLLDRTIFLSHGRSIYYGSPGNIPKFFSDFGMSIPREQNPAEFTLDLIHNLQEDERTDPTTIRRLIAFNRSWGLRNVSKRQPSVACDSKGVSLRKAIINSIPNAKLVDGKMPNYANHCLTEVSNSILYSHFLSCASNIFIF